MPVTEEGDALQVIPVNFPLEEFPEMIFSNLLSLIIVFAEALFGPVIFRPVKPAFPSQRMFLIVLFENVAVPLVRIELL